MPGFPFDIMLAPPPPLAIAGAEAAGIAGYGVLVLVVLRLAVRWAERAVAAEPDVAPATPSTPPAPPARG